MAAPFWAVLFMIFGPQFVTVPDLWIFALAVAGVVAINLIITDLQWRRRRARWHRHRMGLRQANAAR